MCNRPHVYFINPIDSLWVYLRPCSSTRRCCVRKVHFIKVLLDGIRAWISVLSIVSLSTVRCCQSQVHMSWMLNIHTNTPLSVFMFYKALLHFWSLVRISYFYLYFWALQKLFASCFQPFSNFCTNKSLNQNLEQIKNLPPILHLLLMGNVCAHSVSANFIWMYFCRTI